LEELVVSADLRRQLEALKLEEEHVRPRRGRFALILAVLAIVGTVIVLWRTRDTFAAVEVDTVRVTVQASDGRVPDNPVLTASGYVVARRKAVVSAKIQGRLEELHVEEGSRVREGDVIARLESRDFAAQVARAKARVDGVRAQIERADASIARAEADLAEARRQASMLERLVTERVASTDERDAARSRVAIAEASVEQARADRSQALADLSQAEADVRLAEATFQNTLIRAPFDGVVVRKMAEVGESVAPIPPGVNISTASGAIVALADLETLEVEVDVSEANVARLQADQPAEVTVEAFPDRRYRGVLRQVIPTADRTKATVMVKVTILDRDDLLKPEMSARVTFLEPPPADASAEPVPSTVLLVPQQAVVTREGRTQVFEVVADRARVKPVRVGLRQRDQVVISEGLTGGETLVLSPPAELTDGDPVRVKG
jgi:RND family efflux transporter MFP subunit